MALGGPRSSPTTEKIEFNVLWSPKIQWRLSKTNLSIPKTQINRSVLNLKIASGVSWGRWGESTIDTVSHGDMLTQVRAMCMCEFARAGACDSHCFILKAQRGHLRRVMSASTYPHEVRKQYFCGWGVEWMRAGSCYQKAEEHSHVKVVMFYFCYLKRVTRSVIHTPCPVRWDQSVAFMAKDTESWPGGGRCWGCPCGSLPVRPWPLGRATPAGRAEACITVQRHRPWLLPQGNTGLSCCLFWTWPPQGSILLEQSVTPVPNSPRIPPLLPATGFQAAVYLGCTPSLPQDPLEGAVWGPRLPWGECGSSVFPLNMLSFSLPLSPSAWLPLK